jgi:small subunit ribosomal protein S8
MYTDLLVKIKNAQGAKNESLKVPYNNMDMAIAELLAKKGYIESVVKKGRMPKRVIEIRWKYNEGRGAINGTKFLSVPSRRLYVGSKNLRPVKQGYGLGVVTTSKGVMTNEEARRAKVGGQLLFEIW